MPDFNLPPIVYNPYGQTAPDLSRAQVEGNMTTASQDWMLGRDTGPEAMAWANAQYQASGITPSVQAPVKQQANITPLDQWWGANQQSILQNLYASPQWTNAQYTKPASMSYTEYYTRLQDNAKAQGYDQYYKSIMDPINAQYNQAMDVYNKAYVTGANQLPPPGSMWASGGAAGGNTSSTNPYMPAAGNQYQTAIDRAQQVADQQSAALQAAQARADALPEAYLQREKNLSQYLSGLGQSQRDELARTEQAQQSSLQQDMINRGMVSTSVLDSLRGGITKNFGQQRTALEDTLTREKMDYLSALSGETLGARGQAIQGARDTASGVFQMQQSPLAARQAYADALAKQREFDLNWMQNRDSEKYKTALGYAGLRSQEGLAAQQRQLERNQTLADQYMNYSKLTNALHLQNMQTVAGLPNQMAPSAYGLMYGG